MNYTRSFLISLLLFFSAGCVSSTAQWVANKTKPATSSNSTQVPTSSCCPDGPCCPDGDCCPDTSGILINDNSSSAWRVFICIGILILICCSIPYFGTRDRFHSTVAWIKKKLSRSKKES